MRAHHFAAGVVEEALIAGPQAAQHVARLVVAHAVPHARAARLGRQVVHGVLVRLALQQEVLHALRKLHISAVGPEVARSLPAEVERTL